LINREYERRFQVQRDQIRGKTDFDIHSPEFAQMARASDRQVIEAGVPLHSKFLKDYRRKHATYGKA